VKQIPPTKYGQETNAFEDASLNFEISDIEHAAPTMNKALPSANIIATQ